MMVSVPQVHFISFPPAWVNLSMTHSERFIHMQKRDDVWASSDLLSPLSFLPSFPPSILIVKDEKVTAERTDLGVFSPEILCRERERGRTQTHGHQTLAMISKISLLSYHTDFQSICS